MQHIQAEKSCRRSTARILLDHIVLNVDDMSAMIKFYTMVLALPPERLDAFYAGTVPFPSVRINEETIIDLFPKQLWIKEGEQQKKFPNQNHFCLAMSLSDWKNLHMRLDADAIPLVDGPVERWGARGTGISIYFRDPDGNLIEARYYGATNTEEPCLLRS
jgi:glyoxylase I family protein